MIPVNMADPETLGHLNQGYNQWAGWGGGGEAQKLYLNLAQMFFPPSVKRSNN